jgi:hypothetical protein
MYQVLGIKTTLQYFGIGCLIIFLAWNLGRLPTLLEDWSMLWRAMSFSVAIAVGLVIVLGETPIFPFLCRKMPFIRQYFPPIDGLWEVTVRSNWGAIQRLMGNRDVEPLVAKAGTIRITSRFFRVRMVFQGDDGYSTSSSVCVSVLRDSEHDTTQLNYIYHNETRQPEQTDASTHNGAARVDINDEGGVVTMEGVYFTDRKWTEGLNTAGIIRFEKLKT